MFNVKKNTITGVNMQSSNMNVKNRKQFTEELKQLAQKKKPEQQKNVKAKKNSKFISDSSNDDSSSGSESSAQSQSIDSASSFNKSGSDLGEESKPSTKLDNSSISGYSFYEMNAEVLDDFFPSISAEILLIVTYEMIIFVDNNKRENTLLEIKHEDLLYVMGKNDVLKLAFQLNQSALSKEKQKN